MSGGTNTTTSSAPPQIYQDAYSNVLQQAQQQAQQPYQPYTGQIVQGFSPQQQQAFGIVGNAAGNNGLGIAGSYINNAQGLLGQATQPLSTQIGSLESPYTQQVVGATQQSFTNQNAIQNQGIVGNAISSGAWGGDRAGVAQGIAAGQEATAQAPVIAGLENQGFQTALSGAEAQDWIQSQGAFGEANLGTTAQNTALSSANQLLTTGGLQQQLGQEQLNVPYQQYVAQQAWPYQNINFLANIAEGTGSLAGGTGSTSQSAPSTGSQIAGGVADAAALALMFARRGGRLMPHYDSGGGISGIILPAVPDESAAGIIPATQGAQGRGAPTAPAPQAQGSGLPSLGDISSLAGSKKKKGDKSGDDSSGESFMDKLDRWFGGNSDTGSGPPSTGGGIMGMTPDVASGGGFGDDAPIQSDGIGGPVYRRGGGIANDNGWTEHRATGTYGWGGGIRGYYDGGDVVDPAAFSQGEPAPGEMQINRPQGIAAAAPDSGGIAPAPKARAPDKTAADFLQTGDNRHTLAMALLAAGSGMMTNPTRNFGVGLGRGIQAGLQTYQQEQKQGLDAEALAAKVNETKRRLDMEEPETQARTSLLGAQTAGAQLTTQMTKQRLAVLQHIQDISAGRVPLTPGQPVASAGGTDAAPAGPGAGPVSGQSQGPVPVQLPNGTMAPAGYGQTANPHIQRIDRQYAIADALTAIDPDKAASIFKEAAAADPRVVQQLEHVKRKEEAAYETEINPLKIQQAVASQAGRPIAVGPNQTVTTGAQVMGLSRPPGVGGAAAPRQVASAAPTGAAAAPTASAARPAGGGAPAPTDTGAPAQPSMDLIRQPSGALQSPLNQYTNQRFEELAKTRAAAVTTAQQAQQRDNQIDVLDQAIANMKAKGTETGYFTPVLGQIAAAAKSVGIDTSNIPGLPAPETVGDIQTANKVGKLLMGQILKQMFPQRITNVDIVLNKGIAPGPDIDETAVRNLESQIRAQNAYDKKFADQFLDYEARNLQNPLAVLQFEQQFYKKNGYAPLTETFYSQAPGGGANSAPNTTRTGIPEGLPAGSTLFGHTKDGLEVWHDPSGKPYKVTP